MVQYVDGSVIAQMGNPDMRTPISYGMAWPHRIDAGVADLSFKDVLSLNFNAPDFARFPCLKLAMDAMTAGGTTPAILNAANEVAVASFLAESIRFDQISVVNERVLETLASAKVVSVEQVLECDKEARALASQIITRECH
jgi:1-deoxy-D-xylulose-5-phosphate reductoisomerase